MPLPAAASLPHTLVSVKDRALGLHLLFFRVGHSFSEWTPSVEVWTGALTARGQWLLCLVHLPLRPPPAQPGAVPAHGQMPPERWQSQPGQTWRRHWGKALCTGITFGAEWGPPAWNGVHAGSHLHKERTRSALWSLEEASGEGAVALSQSEGL